jgi:putative acetyltransferase
MFITELKIGLVKPSDLAELQKLFVDTVSAICSKDYNGQQIAVWSASIKNTKRWHDMIENHFFIVAQIANKIVGFGTLENGSCLDMMYVHKDFQRQGIASKIYSELEKEAIRLNKITLISYVSKTARPFFEKNGFRIISKKRKILQGVEISNYKMTKELPPDYSTTQR